jgi:(5-formylfuran-3-yl)methyl phosphate synthase
MTEPANAATDRIFVHDFVLPARIGAFDREQDAPQQVRFNVDARIARPAQVPQRLHEVFSYDVITDGIRAIVAQGHVHLAETLAARIAALVLAHPQILSVTVRVEKLEVGPGSVGVEITRAK